MNAWTMAVCDVCRLLDGDYRQKMCQWCGMCQAWVCAADIRNAARRARAMMKRTMGG
jgi:hypothetical protein